MNRRFDQRSIPARPNFKFEKKIWKAGASRIAGLDEAGRGALAGPVVAGVVVFFPNAKAFQKLKGVRDSKEMRPAEREKWAIAIRHIAADWALGSASSIEIDQWGIVPATRLAMQRALNNLKKRCDHILIDALIIEDIEGPQSMLIKGDQRALSIAAASVLAKVSRDSEMRHLNKKFPGYGFSQHKGYGTTMHRKNISALGFSKIHRRSFHVKEIS